MLKFIQENVANIIFFTEISKIYDDLYQMKINNFSHYNELFYRQTVILKL